MMTTSIVIAVFLSLVHAFIDFSRIKDKTGGPDINHLPGAIIYSVICLGAAIAFAEWFYVFPMIFIRPVVFDPVLNLLRKKKPFEVSLTTTSKVDQLELKYLGTNGFVHWIFWVGLTVVSVILVNLFK